MNEIEKRRKRWERRNAEVRTVELSKQSARAELERKFIEYLSRPNVVDSLNLRVEITLKQRRNSELKTARPNNDEITVHVKQRRFAFRDAPMFAPFYFLTDEEVRRIAVRLVNQMNRRIFGNLSRRKTEVPQRLTALICQHDKDTRRHLHCLFAVPSGITFSRFETVLYRALQKEPFSYRIARFEPIEDVRKSILYNANERKSLSRNPVVYLHPQINTASDEPRRIHNEASPESIHAEHDFHPCDTPRTPHA